MVNPQTNPGTIMNQGDMKVSPQIQKANQMPINPTDLLSGNTANPANTAVFPEIYYKLMRIL
jgi:long-subunit fatty acid transport protein